MQGNASSLVIHELFRVEPSLQAPISLRNPLDFFFEKIDE